MSTPAIAVTPRRPAGRTAPGLSRRWPPESPWTLLDLLDLHLGPGPGSGPRPGPKLWS